MRSDRIRLFSIVLAIVATIVTLVGLRSFRKRTSWRSFASRAREIACAREEMRSAALRGDALAYAAKYADAAVVTTRGGNTLLGRTAVESAMCKTLSQAQFTESKIECNAVPAVTDDMFVERGHFRLSAMSARGKMTYAGRFVATWRREDNQWKISAEMIEPLAA